MYCRLLVIEGAAKGRGKSMYCRLLARDAMAGRYETSDAGSVRWTASVQSA
jgi:hypothetical protein